MVDLTTDEQDNSKFITRVDLNDDLETYTVSYADGHVEVEPFESVHNFNVKLYRMEQQYYQYRDTFNEEMNEWYVETIKKSLTEFVLTIVGVILTTRFVPEGLVKTLLIVLMILFSIGYQVLKGRDLLTISYATNYLTKIERFLGVQEKLKVPVKDPKTGKDDEWYLANLSDIHFGSNIGMYEQVSEVLEDPEKKKDEGLRLTKILKGE